MPEEWLIFKSYFNDFDSTVYYADTEGNEIPIKNECDFQEALRLAKLNKKRLKLIVYSNQSEANSAPVKNQRESSDTVALDVKLEKIKHGTMKEDSVPLDMTLETSKHRTMQEDPVRKGKCQCQCQCNEIIPPPWFAHYMKKFKKELLHELKSSLGCSVPIVVEKKLPDLKKEIIDLSCCKIKTTSASIASQSKKKKKGSEKGLGDLLDQREAKIAKKNEKHHPTNFVRLVKLDNKTKVLMEEKRRLLEKKRHLKQRFEKNYGIMELAKPKKSATFGKNEMCLFLPPSAEFVVTLNFTNDGTLRWEAPRLECYDFNGLYPKEYTICLPRLRPMESGFTTLRGKVSQRSGVHYFKCRLFDDQRKIGPEFTCWAKVETTESVEEIPNAIISCKESHKGKIEESVGVLIDFEKDEFTATQKKIEENINEIERRLQDIDLLRPCASSGDITGSKVDLRMSKVPQDNGCDSMQNTEEKEINWKEKLEQEGVHFGVDCLRLTTPSNNHEKEDEDGRVENVEKCQKNVDSGSNSDSESSLIFLSEDDENFVMISSLSESPSCAESVNEDKKQVKTLGNGIANALEAKADSLEQKPLESFKSEILENSKEVLKMSDRRQRLPGPLKNRWPLHEVSKSKAKKIKPNSTEYHFTTPNLTQPSFIQIPERYSEERPSKFTFTGVKNEEETVTHNSAKSRAKERSCPEGVFLKKGSMKPLDQSQKENGFNDYTIPATDGSRNVIYAVNSNGHCFPVGERSEDWDHWRILRGRARERIYPEGVFEKRGSELISPENQKETISTPKCELFERHSHNSTKNNAKERIYPEGVFEKRGSELTSPENGKEKISAPKCEFDCHSQPALTKREEDQSQKENDFKNYTIPSTDDSRNIIYAVNSHGHCFPVGERPQDWDHWRVPRRTETGHLHRSERQDDRFNEVPGVGVLPSLLVNGATNVASRAFNTARSVINNLHSAFVTEGKTEMGKPAFENRQEVSSYPMCILVEMGFTDIELNRYLLLKYQNDVKRVVDDLLGGCYF